MTFIIWNARGVGNALTMARLKLLIKSNNIKCLAILEPKIQVNMLETVCKRLGMDKAVANGDEHAHIWVLWKDPLDLSITC